MRDPFLDWLRAAAISAVAVYHTVQMAPVSLPLARATYYGSLGVDLFFVLSGFLIGGLYFREAQQAGGRIALLRFWQRRWWRTLPPYYAALALSWLAVFIARGEPFDVRYLLFAQNYAPEMPFFLVSWSLCIEEHFYLAVPLLLLGCRALALSPHALLALLVPLPLVLRAWAARDGVSPQFGFDQTATHLHAEGLLMGFLLSGLWEFAPQVRPAAQRAARWAVVPLVCATVFSATRSSHEFVYVLMRTMVALSLSAVLLAGVGGRERPGVLGAAAHRLALISYSVYLTHALVIHATRTLALRYGLGLTSYFVGTALLVVLTGAAFYLAVEKPSLRLRERFAPHRAGGRGQ